MATLRRKPRNEKGYILLSVMLLMVLMLVALTIEAPRVAQQIKREKEEELIHRGDEYKLAIKRFFRKFGRYPLSIDQLENTNNMRFLRKRYKDPMTGKDDWRLIHVGEAMIKIGGTGNLNAPGTGTFGQPIAGNNSGLSPGAGSGLNAGANTAGLNAGGTPTSGDNSNNNNTSAGSGTGNSSGTSTSAFNNGGFQPGGGPIMGVASARKEQSLKIRDEKDHYNEWEFVYDPRLEQQQQLGGVVPNNNLQQPGPNNQNPNTQNPNSMGPPVKQ
jgi:type II secretory pathway pseudopilin PulG